MFIINVLVNIVFDKICGSWVKRIQVGRHTTNLLDLLRSDLREGRQAAIGQGPCEAEREMATDRTRLWGN